MSTEVSNPLLAALKLPGRVFPLPSGGHFYKDGELAPDVFNGEVHVMPMSGIAEMKFRSPDLLYSGKAVTEVIKECVPSILKPEKIISRDVDAILAYIRLVTYGPEIELKSIHNCKDAKEHSYTVNLENIISKIVPLSEEMYKMFFNITLPNKQNLTLCPLRWDDAIILMQLSSQSESSSIDDVDKMFIINNVGMIHSIDGFDDKSFIEQWVKIAPAPYTNQIKTSVSKGLENWSNFEASIKCKDCGESVVLPIDLNPSNFFTQ